MAARVRAGHDARPRGSVCASVPGMKLSMIAVACAAALAFACGSASSDEPSAEEAEADLIAKAPIANFKKVRPGLYRGGHPDAKGLDYLKSIGIKTIVDLEVSDFIEAYPWDIADEVDGARARHLTLVRHPMS